MIRLTSAAAAALLAASAAWAGTAWEDISSELYAGRDLLDGSDVIAIDAPYRTPDDTRTDLAARIAAPAGKTVARVSVILDENPMPVSAVFDLSRPLPRFAFGITMRVNGATPLHVVAETTDGALYVAETFVKTSGTGACAAPPGTDPELALATLGDMKIGFDAAGGTGDLMGRIDALRTDDRRVDIDVSHPSHSGMQMDQISLLFIPMRYVERLEIDLDGADFADLTGSISLSENPSVSLSIPADTRSVDVTMTDTDGTVSTAHADVAGF